MRYGIGRSVISGGSTQNQGGGGLGALFAHGEDGFLFGPFDTFERMFLLSTGATGNIAANNDPVGLNLDRRSWGGASLTAILAAQPESISSPAFAGAVVGVVGSGGALPTGWSIGGAGPTTATVNAITTDAQGNPALDVTLATTAGGSNVFPRLIMSSNISSVIGKTWRGSANIEIVSIASSNVTTNNNGVGLGLLELTAGNVYINENTGAYIFSTGAPAIAPVYKQLAAGPNTKLQINAPAAVEATKTVTLRLKISLVTFKTVPGNHTLQATTTKRPLWKANSGKPNLTYDGVDDFSQSPYIPGQAGTIAIAGQAASGLAYFMSGGNVTGDKRLRLLIAANGFPNLIYNTPTAIPLVAVDKRNTDMTIVVTYDATGWEAYLDGLLVASAATAPNMDGTGQGFALGAIDGGSTGWISGRIYAALARSVRSSPAEIAVISSQFRSTYP